MFKEPIAVPCGKCLYCRQQKASEWTRRLQLEYLNHEHSSFITLTYKEDLDYESELFKHSRELYYRDIQLFMKKLRKQLYQKFDIYQLKFFCAGEYGTQYTKRAHWHLLIFGLEMTNDINEIIEKCWENGISYNEPINNAEGVAKYVSAYVLDKIDTNPDEYEKINKRKAPFHRGSKGLGLEKATELYLKAVTESWTKFKDLQHIIHNGKQIRLCRYLKNKLCEKAGILQEVKEAGIEKMQEYLKETIAIFKQFSTGEITTKTNLTRFTWIKKAWEIYCKNKWYAEYIDKTCDLGGLCNRDLGNLEIISQAWQYRHKTKFKHMKEKFEMWKLDKELKKAI